MESLSFNLPESFQVHLLETWPYWFTACFCGVIALGLEILGHIVHILFGFADKIEVRGKHLDEFEDIDNRYIGINKFLTMIFVYHVIYVTYTTPTIQWGTENVTLLNTLGSLVAFYLCYDLCYMNFHRILHKQEFYAIIHKHHHRQKAPSRGNLDAINVHPFEFVVGEYLHLLVIYFIPCHVFAVMFFIIAGGILASLNHTRHDIDLGFLYAVKAHDVHHRLPESNYGQYIMVWDYFFGSYVPYNEKAGNKTTKSKATKAK